MGRLGILSLSLFVLLTLAACQPAALAPTAPSNPNLILATTTSLQDSGLLDVLIPRFEQQTGYAVKTIAVGTGAALKLGEQGNVDVLLVHAPAAEEAFMAGGFGADRRLVMHNDFVIVGPAADPADIRGIARAAEALHKIAAAGAMFVSRGDNSGTHQVELQLWQAAGVDPAGRPWYLESGQGMGATLRLASEKWAYTLSDRGTYLANRADLELAVLAEDDAALWNVYHVIVVNPAKWPQVNHAGALAFADFLCAPATQEIIRTFGVDRYGQPLFFPDADKTDTELGEVPGTSNAMQNVLELFTGGDPEVWQITLLSLRVSGLATLISLLIGLPLGTALALGRFPGRSFLLSLINTGMALPPVVVGLVVALLLWRNGPLGSLNLMYTPAAIVIAQTIIAAPVVTGLSAAALQALDPRLRLQLLGLGASRVQMVLALWLEARLALLAALMAGFGSVISEVGASLMVGGNIRGQTRVLTTAVVLETGKGEFARAIALGVLLLALSYLVNLTLTWIQQRGARQ